MKYYYKILVSEGVKESLNSINVPESFIENLQNDADFKGELEQHMNEFYMGYDVERIRKGKTPWTWATHNYHYKTNWNFKGEVHPQRNDKIKQLKKNWNE